MLGWIFPKTKSLKDKPAARAKTLCDIYDGQNVLIQCLKGDTGDCQRLREMGFCEKARVEKVTENGALICKICDSKVIISQELAKNVVVQECGDQSGGSMTEPGQKIILLSELSEGQQGRIHGFIDESDTCARLEEMGLTPGEPVQVVRYAPLGDPIEIKVRGYHLSLRRDEADFIQIQI